MRRRIAGLGRAAPLALLCLAGCRAEKPYPSQPIVLICPWGAGGGTDTIARWTAALLEQDLGVPVNVVNATGGAGVTGHTRGAVVRPDGTTMTMITVEIAMLHWRGLTSISGKDFTPVMLLGRDPAAVFVRSDAPWKTIGDLEEHVRGHPGALRASGTAEWGIWHLALAGWLVQAGLRTADANWISINGAKPSLLQLLSGGVDVVCCSLPEAKPNLDGAQVRCLGVMADSRLAEFPEVPTFREQGQRWSLSAWRGIALPRGVSKEVVETIAAALGRITRGEKFQTWMQESGYSRASEGPVEFAATMEQADRDLGAILTSDAFRGTEKHRVGPMFYPGLLAVGLLVVLIALITTGGLGLASEAPTLSRAGLLRFAEVIGGVALYLLLSEPVGFIITAAALLFLWMARLGTRPWVAAAVAVTLVPAAYEVFAILLRVPLPAESSAGDMAEVLTQALEKVFLDPQVLGIILLSAVYGMLVGSIPGFSATMAVALIIPLTFFLGPLHTLSAVVTLEACAIFAGDIPAALIRMPGTPASAAYTDDLYQLGRRGQAQAALGVSLLSSVAGGLFGTLVLILLARPAAGLAASFTVIEYFWFYALGLGCAVVVSRGSALRGALGLIIGLLISTVGLSAVHTQSRFTFGIPQLYDGIGFIPAMIGLFGVSEILRNALRGELGAAPSEVGSGLGSDGAPPAAGGWERPAGQRIPVFGAAWPLLWLRKLQFLLSSMIGTVIGILPGAGADIAAWVTFGVSKRFSRRPEEYGRGSFAGVFDASAANNAALAGAWVPALIFGIPGDSITALVIGIMMMKNLRPGPDIFEKQGVLLHSLFLVFILANLLLIPIGYLAIKAGGYLIRVPRKVLMPVILLFCVLGVYSLNGSAFDVWVMLAMGLLGFVLERRQVPLGPVVLGIVLGGSVEETFIQSLTASEGSLLGFVSRPASIILAAACASLWLWPVVGLIVKRARRGARG